MTSKLLTLIKEGIMDRTAIRVVESARNPRRLAINLVHQRRPGAKIPLARDLSADPS